MYRRVSTYQLPGFRSPCHYKQMRLPLAYTVPSTRREVIAIRLASTAVCLSSRWLHAHRDSTEFATCTCEMGWDEDRGRPGAARTRSSRLFAASRLPVCAAGLHGIFSLGWRRKKSKSNRTQKMETVDQKDLQKIACGTHTSHYPITRDPPNYPSVIIRTIPLLVTRDSLLMTTRASLPFL